MTVNKTIGGSGQGKTSRIMERIDSQKEDRELGDREKQIIEIAKQGRGEFYG